MRAINYASAMDLCSCHRSCMYTVSLNHSIFQSRNLFFLVVHTSCMQNHSWNPFWSGPTVSVCRWASARSLQAGPRMAPAGQERCHAFWYIADTFSFQASNKKLDGYQGSHLACPFHIEILIFKELWKYCYNVSYPKIKLTSDKSFMRAGVTQQEECYSWCAESVEKACEIAITAKLYIAWRCMQTNSEGAGWAWIIQDSFG